MSNGLYSPSLEISNSIYFDKQHQGRLAEKVFINDRIHNYLISLILSVMLLINWWFIHPNITIQSMFKTTEEWRTYNPFKNRNRVNSINTNNSRGSKKNKTPLSYGRAEYASPRGKFLSGFSYRFTNLNLYFSYKKISENHEFTNDKESR